MLEEGAMLQDRYRIVRILGGGGMGQVYLAHDTRLADKPCAVKELLPDPRATPEEQRQAAAQFYREAAILAHLSHSNLPNVFDYFEQEGNLYLVMDYIEGETLLDRLHRSPQGLPVQDVVAWAVQLCDVLQYLHEQQPPVIFRDLKPANVMVTPDGMIKLIDFGIARLFDPGKSTDTLKMGTAGYAPPEQYAGQGQTTPRSDIYALGVTLHELLTGEDPTAHPFVFTPPHELNRNVPPPLSDVVMKALSINPDDRFPSAMAMKEAIQRAARPTGGLRSTLLQRRRSTGTAMMAAAPAVPARRGVVLRFSLGLLRWLTRLALTILITLVVAALALLLLGAFALSAIAQQAVANADWGLTEDVANPSITTEEELEEEIRYVLNLYALDAVSDPSLDFHPPDVIELSLRLSSRPLTLEASLTEQDGVPVLTIRRLNGVPLYVVGGIISGGINRGFREAWQGAPIQIATMRVEEERIVVTIQKVP